MDLDNNARVSYSTTTSSAAFAATRSQPNFFFWPWAAATGYAGNGCVPSPHLGRPPSHALGPVPPPPQSLPPPPLPPPSSASLTAGHLPTSSCTSDLEQFYRFSANYPRSIIDPDNVMINTAAAGGSGVSCGPLGHFGQAGSSVYSFDASNSLMSNMHLAAGQYGMGYPPLMNTLSNSGMHSAFALAGENGQLMEGPPPHPPLSLSFHQHNTMSMLSQQNASNSLLSAGIAPPDDHTCLSDNSPNGFPGSYSLCGTAGLPAALSPHHTMTSGGGGGGSRAVGKSSGSSRAIKGENFHSRGGSGQNNLMNHFSCPAPPTKGYKCKMCHQLCFSRHDLAKHNSNVHKSDPRPYRCEHCGRQFSTSAYLSQHRRIHLGIKPYACRFCERRFTQLSHVQQHERIHTGEKPYRCSSCMKSFTQMSNLQSHQRQHMKGKPFRCDNCFMSFDGHEDLETHIQAKHAGHKYSKILVCPICTKNYNSETYLNKHLLKHKESVSAAAANMSVAALASVAAVAQLSGSGTAPFQAHVPNSSSCGVDPASAFHMNYSANSSALLMRHKADTDYFYRHQLSNMKNENDLFMAPPSLSLGATGNAFNVPQNNKNATPSMLSPYFPTPSHNDVFAAVAAGGFSSLASASQSSCFMRNDSHHGLFSGIGPGGAMMPNSRPLSMLPYYNDPEDHHHANNSIGHNKPGAGNCSGGGGGGGLGSSPNSVDDQRSQMEMDDQEEDDDSDVDCSPHHHHHHHHHHLHHHQHHRAVMSASVHMTTCAADNNAEMEKEGTDKGSNNATAINLTPRSNRIGCSSELSLASSYGANKYMK